MKTLLTPKEVTMCKQIAAANNRYSQRAAALLTIHAGATHNQAGLETGLSIGQVKYCITRFRRLRLACFPDSATTEPESEAKAKVSKSKPEKTKKKDKQKAKDKDKSEDKKKDKNKKKDKDKKKAKKAKKKK
jgi:hypothetical protein